jgi:ABC-type sugar transport system ATPase subunit
MGVVQQIGSPREVYTSPDTLFVASFLGSPSINVLPIEFEGSESTVLGARVAAPRAARHAAIRPEHVAIGEDGGLGASWRATVRVVEPLGGETVLHCEVAGATLRVKEHGFSPRAPGDEIALHAPREAIAFFDEAGRRIAVEAGA